MAETMRVRGYETKDVRPKWVVVAAAGLAVTLIVVGLVIWGLLAVLHGGVAARRPALTSVERTELTPPEPRLAVNPQEDVAAHRRAAAERLGGYGWSNREHGLAHIPIDEAMKRLAESGWPSADPQRGTVP
jgi:hypothetical protein